MSTYGPQQREDYALERVPEEDKRWSGLSLFNTLVAGSSALFFFAFGGQLVEHFGTVHLILAMVVAMLFVGSVG